MGKRFQRRMLRGRTRFGADHVVLFRSPIFLAFVLGGGLIFGGMMTDMSSSAFLPQGVYGLSATGYAVVLGGHGLIMILGAQVGARLSHRVRPQRIELIGSAGLVASSAALVVSVTLVPQTGFVGFLVPLLCFTAFLGLAQREVLAPHLMA